ncbi:MAG: aminofutalosine synthase MqnE, partial [Deltaproteobacteria bacterium]|nr:aminofutalosine synthase MqnE [Deltaproteobacteria bacterium]
MAGGESEQALGHKTLIKLIREAGREPVERDTLYNVLETF